jgi:hypothetical protein
MDMSDRAARSLYELIGAPLMALVDAESQAAKATANFIKSMGFEPADPPTSSAPEDDRPENFGHLKMVTFRYQRRDAEGQPQTFKVEVPLLSLIPIPALQIKNAELEFFAKIIDYPKVAQAPRQKSAKIQKQGDDSESGGERERADKYDIMHLPGRDLKATFGNDASTDPGGRTRKLDMQIKMKIKMEQADIPAGLGNLFNLMQQNITSTRE